MTICWEGEADHLCIENWQKHEDVGSDSDKNDLPVCVTLMSWPFLLCVIGP